VISAPLLVILSLGALSASLALLVAHLQFPLAADLLAVSGAIFGLLAVLTAGVSTLRRARQLPTGQHRQ
jgi:hypothetical protein